ncbi:MAG: NADH-quinone oxidoreductase subunit NuoE [Proteobacteria bacterium]|nr:NADH-quinone oxidoreductase subunit NuoE [Pseudomonadota bacterium]
MSVTEVFNKYEPKKENLLLILHDIQDSIGSRSIDETTLKKVAEYLDMSLSQVYGVVSFYTMYSTKPRGKYIIRICQSPTCHLMGSKSLLEHLKETLKIDVNETTSDKMFTLETSSCLGVCSEAPAMMINDTVYGNLTEEKVNSVLEKLRSNHENN